MNQPAISIVVTNYNYSRYLAKCVASCIGQRGGVDYEVLIVDDGSTDDSVATVRPLVGGKVRLIERSNGGIEAASNAGIAQARAEFVVRVDADDYLLPDFLQTMVPQLSASAHAFAYSDYVIVDGADAVLYEEKLPNFSADEIRTRGDFLATGTVYRRSVVGEAGGYGESTRNCGLENYELILKLLRMGCTGLHVASPLFAYRRHGMNVSARRKESIISYGRQLFDAMGLGPYRTNAFHPYRLELDHE